MEISLPGEVISRSKVTGRISFFRDPLQINSKFSRLIILAEEEWMLLYIPGDGF